MLDGLKSYFRHFSWPILLAMISLLAISVTAVRMAENVNAGTEGYATRQMIFGLVALAGFFAVTLINYQRIGRYSYFLLAITIGLLILVFLFPDKRGSRRWIYLPGMADSINLQPSEVAKVTYIIALAWYLRFRSNYRQLRGLIVPFLITLVPLVLIFKEPDLGTSLLLLPTLIVMLFMAGAKLRHLLVIVLLGVLVVMLPAPREVDQNAFNAQIDRFRARRLGPVTFYSVDTQLPWRSRPEVPVAYFRYRIGQGDVYDLQPLCLRKMNDYQAYRIEGWLRQDDPRVREYKGYQLYQSMTALGSGQLYGQGGWDESSIYFRMLPDDHTDFIYAVVGGQWGFVGCVGVLVLYAIIFIFGVDVATSTQDPFGRLLAVGVLALLAAQVFINIGMTMGMMPITGMTLPLVSYGGSSLLVNGVALGLLVNVGQRRPVSLAPKPFEYGSGRSGDQSRLSSALPGRSR